MFHGDRNLRAQLCINLGKAGYTDNLHTTKVQWYCEAYTILGTYGNKNLRAEALILLGNERHTDATHTAEVDWYKEAIGVLGKDGEARLQAQACIGLGDCGYTDATHQDSAKWYLDALSAKIGDSDNEEVLKARACIGLGRAHYAKDQHKLVSKAHWYVCALRHLENVFVLDVSSLLLAEVFIGLGDAGYTDYKASYYFDTKRRTVDYWYLRALHFNAENGDRTLYVRTLIGLGNYYCSQNDTARGLDCFQKALVCAPEDMKMSIQEKIQAIQDLIRSHNAAGEDSKATHSSDREVIKSEE